MLALLHFLLTVFLTVSALPYPLPSNGTRTSPALTTTSTGSSIETVWNVFSAPPFPRPLNGTGTSSTSTMSASTVTNSDIPTVAPTDRWLHVTPTNSSLSMMPTSQSYPIGQTNGSLSMVPTNGSIANASDSRSPRFYERHYVNALQTEAGYTSASVGLRLTTDYYNVTGCGLDDPSHCPVYFDQILLGIINNVTQATPDRRIDANVCDYDCVVDALEWTGRKATAVTMLYAQALFAPDHVTVENLDNPDDLDDVSIMILVLSSDALPKFPGSDQEDVPAASEETDKAASVAKRYSMPRLYQDVNEQYWEPSDTASIESFHEPEWRQRKFHEQYWPFDGPLRERAKWEDFIDRPYDWKQRHWPWEPKVYTGNKVFDYKESFPDSPVPPPSEFIKIQKDMYWDTPKKHIMNFWNIVKGLKQKDPRNGNKPMYKVYAEKADQNLKNTLKSTGGKVKELARKSADTFKKAFTKEGVKGFLRWQKNFWDGIMENKFGWKPPPSLSSGTSLTGGQGGRISIAQWRQSLPDERAYHWDEKPDWTARQQDHQAQVQQEAEAAEKQTGIEEARKGKVKEPIGLPSDPKDQGGKGQAPPDNQKPRPKGKGPAGEGPSGFNSRPKAKSPPVENPLVVAPEDVDTKKPIRINDISPVGVVQGPQEIGPKVGAPQVPPGNRPVPVTEGPPVNVPDLAEGKRPAPIHDVPPVNLPEGSQPHVPVPVEEGAETVHEPAPVGPPKGPHGKPPAPVNEVASPHVPEPPEGKPPGPQGKPPGPHGKPPSPHGKSPSPDRKPSSPHRKPSSPHRKPHSPHRKPHSPHRKPHSPHRKKPHSPHRKPHSPHRKSPSPHGKHHAKGPEDFSSARGAKKGATGHGFDNPKWNKVGKHANFYDSLGGQAAKGVGAAMDGAADAAVAGGLAEGAAAEGAAAAAAAAEGAAAGVGAAAGAVEGAAAGIGGIAEAALGFLGLLGMLII